MDCIFIGYVKHFKAFGFYVIESSEFVSINSIIESSDVIFDENRFSFIPRPSRRSLINRTNDIGDSEVHEKVYDEVVDQQPNLRKSKRVKTPKLFGHEFLLNLIKEAISDEMDSIMGNNTWELVDLPPSLSTPMDTSKKMRPNNGQAVSQLKYSKVIGCLMYVMTCTRSDISFAAGKVSRYTSDHSTQHWQAVQWVLEYLKKTMDYSLTFTGYPLNLEGYTNANWISNTEKNSSTSGLVCLGEVPSHGLSRSKIASQAQQ
ncbi:zinc finger, CCHC-type containing protein [Tanacetum coccineum]